MAPVFDLKNTILELLEHYEEDQNNINYIMRQIVRSEKKLKNKIYRNLNLENEIDNKFLGLLILLDYPITSQIMHDNFKFLLIKIMEFFPKYNEWQARADTFEKIYDEIEDYLKEFGFTAVEDYLLNIRYGTTFYIDEITDIEHLIMRLKKDLLKIPFTKDVDRIITRPIDIKTEKGSVYVNLILGLLKSKEGEMKALDQKALEKVLIFYYDNLFRELVKTNIDQEVIINLEINNKKFSMKL